MSEELQDRIYRSLYVHSLGFYSLVEDLTKHLDDSRSFLRINVWKVFQILLEFACKSDYKLITQTMEETNVKELNALHEKMEQAHMDIVKQE